MSDESVRRALRSDASLVVIEAPAGCGKTHQGADYVSDLVAGGSNRVLILAHTHAACSVFAERTRGVGFRAEIRTIDSMIAEIATAYHVGIGVTADPTVWVRQREDGHAELATKIAKLLKRYPMIAHSLATRYTTVICDEHQDSSGDQHAIVISLHEQGARLRLFADPMQKIFKEKRSPGSNVAYSWDGLISQAGASEALDAPHRWTSGCPRLGEWTLKGREALKSGGKVDLTQAPPSVRVVCAENLAQRNLDYRLHPDNRPPIDAFERHQTSLLVLTRHNDTARALRSFFHRRILLWEGHTRSALEGLIDGIQADQTPESIAAGIVTFMSAVSTGFSPTAFGDRFQREVRERCTSRTTGKPATIQVLASLVIDEPNHHGVAKMLKRLHELVQTDPVFKDIKFDCHKEILGCSPLGRF